MALPSVGNSIRDWTRQWQVAVEGRPTLVDFALPAGQPTPLGYVSQQFSVYGKRPAAAFRVWLTRISAAYLEGVLTPLGAVSRGDEDQLGALKNLGALVPLAQQGHKAIFELTGTEARGTQYTRAQDSLKLFEGIAAKIVARLSK